MVSATMMVNVVVAQETSCLHPPLPFVSATAARHRRTIIGPPPRALVEYSLLTLRHMDIDKMVGGGTFGVVFKAAIKETGRRVALKKFKLETEVQGQGGFPLQALREIRILKAVRHPNIVELFCIITYLPGDDDADGSMERTHGFAAGDIFMVFEYVDYDLSGLLKCRDVDLTEQHVRSYAKQLLEGIDYLHTNKILHRDIKGPNILVTKDNVVKIADLGLARSYKTLDQKLTNSNSVVTLWYRSPELLLGTRNYGPEVDIWSVGCLFGEMKARDAIFKGTSEPEQLEKIYRVCGTPQGDVEEMYRELPEARNEKMQFTRVYPNVLRKRYEMYDEHTLSLLEQLLDTNPRTRISAKRALDHDYFWHQPLPSPEQLPRFSVEVATDMSETERMKAERAARIAAEEERVRQETAGGGPGGGGGGRGGRGPGAGRLLPGGRNISTLKANLKFAVTKPGAASRDKPAAAPAPAAAASSSGDAEMKSGAASGPHGSTTTTTSSAGAGGAGEAETKDGDRGR